MNDVRELQGQREKRSGRWAALGVLGLAALIGSAALYRRARSPGELETADPARRPSAIQDGGALQPSAIPPPVVRPSEATTAGISPVHGEDAKTGLREPIFDLWRAAILTKNAPQVLSAERSFLADPGRYHDGLTELARKDPEERVRSFSTRELGKFALSGDVDFFTKLLENDSCPWVRQNAAWALGELRQGAAAGTLGRISKEDPDRDVRAAAALALSRIH